MSRRVGGGDEDGRDGIVCCDMVVGCVRFRGEWMISRGKAFTAA